MKTRPVKGSGSICGIRYWDGNHRKKSNTFSNWLNGAGGLPGGSDGKESTCNAGDPGSILGSGISPEEANGYQLQYSCLENSMHREACGLLSTGLQRVAHDRASNTHAPSLLFIAEECSTECVTPLSLL